MLQRIADAAADYKDFSFVSKAEFVERMSEARKTLRSLGSLQEVALFAREELGDDQMYRYRARYDRGLQEVNLGYAPDGRIAELDFRPVSDWTAPIQE